jgi:hypothetical protein
VRISSTFGIQNKIEPELYCVMSRRISTFEPDSATKEPSQFAYNGHHIEIVQPDEEHLKGNFWQIKIDGALQPNVLYSSPQVAADAARQLIDQPATG